MVRKKIAVLIISMSLLATNMSFNSTVFANSSNTNQVKSQSTNLEQVDKASIENIINEVLSLGPDVLKTGKSKDYSTIVKDSKLLELLNKQSKFDVEWFKKFDGKIDNYVSNVTITNLTKTAMNTYIVDVLYNVKFKLYGAQRVSTSQNEKYKFEIKHYDGKYYITKKLNLNEDTNIPTTRQVNTSKSSKTENISFFNYGNIINSKIKILDDKFKNIDTYYQQFKQIESKIDDSSVISRSYSGYNASDAVYYARRYAKSPNYLQYPASKKYIDKNVDCTDFVSQCVRAGGVPTSSYWYAYSAPWINVVKFHDYMTSNGYASSKSWTNGARLGDVIQFYNPSAHQWTHSVILTGNIQGTRWVYCGHSNPRIDYPVYEAYAESGYTNIRTLAFWH